MDKFKQSLMAVYGQNKEILSTQNRRFEKLTKKHKNLFGDQTRHLFSTPGRTEIGGNHTDHNLGMVLAASVNLDSIAVASENNERRIVLYSENYPDAFEVDLNYLHIKQEERGTTSSLIRGIAARFAELGHRINGFSACISSEVLPGSGLSSSASIEVLIGTILNNLFNAGNIPAEKIAMIGQFAENNYFGKPCGLMDQIACAVGGIMMIDFMEPDNPQIRPIDFDFDSRNYTILVVDSGDDHADLTDDYAAIPGEMISVARELGYNHCRDLDYDLLLNNIKYLRDKVSDRAILRAFHFLEENQRVLQQVKCLEKNNFKKFLSVVTASGNSSFKWLQNIYSPKTVAKQGLSIALALTEKFIDEKGEGACRVHGGGFAGTIQVFLPDSQVPEYVENIQKIFGSDSIRLLKIRSTGTTEII